MPVKIKGSEYTTVAERLNAIHEKESSKLTILTEILFEDDIGITMKATVKISGDDPQQFEGHARELYSSNKNEVNFAFALENCETSAIGRALASAGYAGKKFSSAEEMKSIERKTKAREDQLNAKNNPEAVEGVANIKDAKKKKKATGTNLFQQVWELAQERGLDRKGMYSFMSDELGRDVSRTDDLNDDELKKVYDALKAREDVEVAL